MKLRYSLPLVLLLSIALYLQSTVHTRLYFVTGENNERILYSAKHVFLPWFTEPRSSEEIFDLAGENNLGLSARVADTTLTKDEQYKRAGELLIAYGVFPESKGWYVEKRDQGWVLCKPAKTTRYFTMRMPVQIWWGSPKKR